MPAEPAPGPWLRAHGRPAAGIEALSVARVARRVRGPLPPEPLRGYLLRVASATGDASLARRLRAHPGFVAALEAALARGAPLLVDSRMLAAGLDRGRLARLGVAVSHPAPAVEPGGRWPTATARAMAQLLAAPDTAGAVVAVGTAPTALLAVLDAVETGWRPAAVVGLPCGFVVAATSKRGLQAAAVPWLTLPGARGGCAMAAAVLNSALRRLLPPDGARA